MACISFLLSSLGNLVVAWGVRSTREDRVHARNCYLADISERGDDEILRIVSPHRIFDADAIKFNVGAADYRRGRALQMIVENIRAIGGERGIIDRGAIGDHKNDLSFFGSLLHRSNAQRTASPSTFSFKRYGLVICSKVAQEMESASLKSRWTM